MRNAPVSISEYMYVGQVTRFSCRRKQYCDCRQEYCCPKSRHRVSKARILQSGNGLFRLAIEIVRLERENFLSDNGISSKKMAVILVRDGNVVVKKGNIAVGDKNVEVGKGKTNHFRRGYRLRNSFPCYSEKAADFQHLKP